MAQTTFKKSIKLRNSNINSGNIIGSYNKTVYKSDEDVQIIRWLSPLEPENRYHSVCSDRFDGVGSWLLDTTEFGE